jgi:Haem-NO-binding
MRFMHGIIFNELKKYANTTFGDRTWEALLAQAGLEGSVYLASRSYPDEQVGAIVAAASSATKMPPAEILEGFGEFIAPDLLAMFRSLIRPDWRTLDVLENTEETIHKVVRVQYAEAVPPYLNAKRTAPDSVLITYTSPRRLCSVARGIVRGMAAHYGESIDMTEPACMLRGDADCQIVVRVMAH